MNTSVIAGFADGNILKINVADLRSKRFPEWTAQNINNRILDRCKQLAAERDAGIASLLTKDQVRQLEAIAAEEQLKTSRAKRGIGH
jgi:hypothetical protein